MHEAGVTRLRVASSRGHRSELVAFASRRSPPAADGLWATFDSRHVDDHRAQTARRRAGRGLAVRADATT